MPFRQFFREGWDGRALLEWHSRIPHWIKKNPFVLGSYTPKGQLISKCLFGLLTFFLKTNENMLTSSKVEFVCLFLEERLAWKNHFAFVWPLWPCTNLLLKQSAFSQILKPPYGPAQCEERQEKNYHLY